MIIEKFFVQIDQPMNVEMIHVKRIFLLIYKYFYSGIGQQNGWYADNESQCRIYYLCADQRKTKMGECSSGLKWNSQRLRCEDPRNIPAPCKLH
jgi:hypothetical protein